MRVRFAAATGCPMGQFVIEAENDDERAILRQFVNTDQKVWRFWLHGTSGTLRVPYTGPDSFNFGWIKPPTFAKLLRYKWARAYYSRWLRPWRIIRAALNGAGQGIRRELDGDN